MFIKLLKPLSFLPAICLMYMIFTFSSQDAITSSQLSYKVSYKIVEIGGEILGADFESWEIDNIALRFHGAIRKIAHMTEYFALAIAVAFPLYVYGLRGIWLMLVAGLFCVAFACGDEYHQAYVDGRGPSKRDVLIDSFGVFWGIVLVRIIGWTGRKTIFRPFGKKKKQKAADGNQTYSEPIPNGYAQQPYQAQVPNGYAQQPYQSQIPNGYARQPYQSQVPNSYTRQPYQSQAPNGYAQHSYQSQTPNSYAQQPYQSQVPNGAYGQPSYHGYPQGRGNAQSAYNEYTHGNAYGQHPYQQQGAYGYPPYPSDDMARETSDRLSEDMSFKKLMHDLKDQKHHDKKPPVRGQNISTHQRDRKSDRWPDEEADRNEVDLKEAELDERDLDETGLDEVVLDEVDLNDSDN